MVRIYELHDYGTYAVWNGMQHSEVDDRRDIIVQYDRSYPKKTVNVKDKKEGKHIYKVIDEKTLRNMRREAQGKRGRRRSRWLL